MRKKLLLTCYVIATLAVNAANIVDNDGDGLPDIWEANFGLSTNDATGINGPLGDPDCDELPNIGEYLAGYTVIGENVYSNYTFAVAGLNPTNSYSYIQDLPDGFIMAGSNKVCLSWLFSDHDMVDTDWELVKTNNADHTYCDGSIVVDGWSNYSRCRMSRLGKAPTVKLWLTTSVKEPIGPVTIMAFSDINSRYDAKWVVDGANKVHILATPIDGRLLEKSIYWIAYAGTGKWNGGPFGFAYAEMDYGTEYSLASKYYAVNSWDVSNIKIRLRQNSAEFFTYNMPNLSTSDGSLKAKSRVRVMRDLVDGVPYNLILIDKTVYNDDAMITPLDYVYNILESNTTSPIYGKSSAVATYNVYTGFGTVPENAVKAFSFTNTYTSATVVNIWPPNGAIINANNIVVKYKSSSDWSRYTTIRMYNKATGEEIASTRVICPPVDLDGNNVVSTPIFVSDDNGTTKNSISNGTIVEWKVEADMVLGRSSSTKTTFKVQNSGLLSNTGTINVNVKYPGIVYKKSSLWPDANNAQYDLYVDIRADRNLHNMPVARKVIDTRTVKYSLTNIVTGVNIEFKGIEPSTYYVSAYINYTGDGIGQKYYAYGYANMRGVSGYSTYDFKPIKVTVGKVSNASVIIQDSDQDGDGYPDGYELVDHAYDDSNPLGYLGPSTNSVNPYLY